MPHFDKMSTSIFYHIWVDLTAYAHHHLFQPTRHRDLLFPLCHVTLRTSLTGYS